MAEPLKATFFTLRRRDRAVLLPATIVFLFIMALILAAFVALNWGTFVHFRDVMLQADPQRQMNEQEGAQFVTRFFGLFGMIFLFLFPIYIAIAAYEAACLRWMIRGEAPGLFGITIDNDVWRVWGVYWCWLIAQFAIGMAMSIVTMPMMFMTMGEIMGDPTPEAMMRWQLTVQLPLALLQYIPLIFIGIRLGPAAATSVLRNRFSFFEAWTVTRGRFWALFGSHFVLWLLLGIVMTIVIGGAYAIALSDLLPRMLASWPGVGPEEIAERVFTPLGLTVFGAAYAAYGVLFLVYSVLAFGINARAVLAARDEDKITVPEGA